MNIGLKITRRLLGSIKNKIKHLFYFVVFRFFSMFPLKNKVVATSFNGMKYEDNPRFIVETLRRIGRNIDFVWLVDSSCCYLVPNYIRKVPFQLTLRTVYEMATAKVWISNNLFNRDVKKRKGQIYFETWHGGLGIKRIVADVQGYPQKEFEKLRNFLKIADLFVSNSDHLNSVYRSALGYEGLIWKCGYPKNDALCGDCSKEIKRLRDALNLQSDTKIFVYAPTFRESIWRDKDNYDISVYDVDYSRVLSALEKKFSGNWVVCVRWHPALKAIANKLKKPSNIIDVTNYPDMVELVKGCDAFMTDYSSCIFDAALVKKPCFMFTLDFDKYKSEQGVYYELEELPFSYARNNNELVENIINFSNDDYQSKWNAFKERMGLYESGHAAEDIAYVISEYLNGDDEPLQSVYKQCL